MGAYGAVELECPLCHTPAPQPSGAVLRCRSCAFAAPYVNGGHVWRERGAPRTTARAAALNAAPNPLAAAAVDGPGATRGWPETTYTFTPAPPSLGLAIAALILNILVAPGIGSLVGGRWGAGFAQLALSGSTWVLVMILAFSSTVAAVAFVPLAIVLGAAAWIWGIVTGVQLLEQAR